MFDSHCHLNFKAFAEDAPAVANAMANDQVAGLVVGCDLASSRYAIELAQSFSNLWASVGVHPMHVVDRPWDPLLMKELGLENRVVAIGEVGLDFYRLPGDTAARRAHIDRQYQTFRAALELAGQVDKPLVLHCRQAHADRSEYERSSHEQSEYERNPYDAILTLLSNHLNSAKSATPRGTIHCFMGDWQQAQQFIDLGFSIGFTGVITYADVDPGLIAVVKNVPLEKILIETDAPYLTPEPYRTQGRVNAGKIPRNLPQYVLEVAKKIAEVKAMNLEKIVEITDRNARSLFRIANA